MEIVCLPAGTGQRPRAQTEAHLVSAAGQRAAERKPKATQRALSPPARTTETPALRHARLVKGTSERPRAAAAPSLESSRRPPARSPSHICVTLVRSTVFSLPLPRLRGGVRTNAPAAWGRESLLSQERSQYREGRETATSCEDPSPWRSGHAAWSPLWCRGRPNTLPASGAQQFQTEPTGLPTAPHSALGGSARAHRHPDDCSQPRAVRFSGKTFGSTTPASENSLKPF